MNQQKNSGFTIIEIIITITIMAMLATIAVISLRTSRNAAEDRERKDDVTAIARHFESFYKNSEGVPSYPTTTEAASPGALTDIEPAALKSPKETVTATPFSLQAASNNSDPPSIPANKYIYQPLKVDGNLCTSGICVSFKIWYKNSSGATIKIESINR